MTAKQTEGLTLPLRQSELEKAKDELKRRLTNAVRDAGRTGDAGRIFHMMSDLRAMEFITPGLEEVQPADPVEPTAKQLAASDDALMQEQNRVQNLREKAQSVATEVHGLPDEKVEALEDADLRATAKTGKLPEEAKGRRAK